MVDLTLLIHEDMAIFPGAYHQIPTFLLRAHWDREKHLSRVVIMSEHTGTHIDAPTHFIRDGKAVDEIPIEQLTGEGVIWKIAKGEREKITAEDLKKAKPEMRENDIVFINTGWGVGNDLLRPGLAPDAAEWLVKKKVKVVGSDTIAIQPQNTIQEEIQLGSVHMWFLTNDIPIVECLANLNDVAGKRAWIAICPLPIKGGSGSPARVFAIVGQ